MTRTEVYNAIDSEREYQLQRWTQEHEDRNTIYDFISTIDSYLAVAGRYSSGKLTNDKEALNAIRKITAVGVACLEKFGVEER